MMPRLEEADFHLSFAPVPIGEGDLGAALGAAFGPAEAWLLGHADDGVLWGFLRGGILTTSAAQPPPGAPPQPLLRRETLIDLHLFNPQIELRVFRRDGALTAIRVEEGQTPGATRYDARATGEYLLLGHHQPDRDGGDFVLFRGAGGRCHTPPRIFGLPTRLKVRHYYLADDTGLLFPAEHRYEALLGDATGKEAS